jgi:hypothetical protein
MIMVVTDVNVHIIVHAMQILTTAIILFLFGIKNQHGCQFSLEKRTVQK